MHSTPENSNPQDNEPPKVYAIKRRGSLWSLDRRSALKTMAAGASALAAAGCNQADAPAPQAAPAKKLASGEFSAGTNSFQLLAFKDYNGTLPRVGTNLYVVAHVEEDYYFRAFDSGGRIVFTWHESTFDPAHPEIARLKSLVREVESRGRFEAAEQGRFAELVTTISRLPQTGRRMQASVGSASPGRRMQNAAGEVTGTGRRAQGAAESAPATGRRMQGTESTAAGKRMQGAAESETSTGRRMQGSAGQFENGKFRQLYGDLSIGGRVYRNAYIEGHYTDGTCRIEHSDGRSDVQTVQLSELVRMQLPQPITRPTVEAGSRQATTTSTSHETTRSTTVTVPQSRPAPRSTDTYRTYTYHYWRPN